MSRDDGFAVADIDSGYLEDAKMRELWQRIRDEDRMARAVLLHKATLLASWRHGERVTVAQASPTWLTVDADLVGHLKAVRLLDRDGRVSRASWSHWFGAACARRDAKREAGRAGGLARARNKASGATAEPQQRSGSAQPVRPSVPAYPTVPSDRPSGSPSDDARDDLEAWLDVRRNPPTPAQRRFLDDYCRTFDETGPKRAAALIYRNTSDAIAALKADLSAFRSERAAGLEDESRAAMDRKVAERRPPTVLRRVDDPTSDEDAERIAAEYLAKHDRKVTA